MKKEITFTRSMRKVKKLADDGWQLDTVIAVRRFLFFSGREYYMSRDVVRLHYADRWDV
jgi:hypothetical protein